MSRRQLIRLMLVALVWLSGTRPAWAQKTEQKASRSQVVVMLIFSAIGLILLNYLRIP
jgi:hypothetical protein